MSEDFARFERIAQLYVWWFNRAPDEGIWAHYMSGAPIEDIETNFALGPERRNLIRDECYGKILGRAPDEVTVKELGDHAARGQRLHDLQIQMHNGPEGQARLRRMFEAGPPAKTTLPSYDGPMRLARRGDTLVGPRLIDGRLIGLGQYGMLCDRQVTMDGLETAVRLVSELSGGRGGVFRFFLCLGLYGRRDDFIHYQKNKEEFGERLAHVIQCGREYGVYPQPCWFDEPARNDRDRRGAGYDRSDNSLLGANRLTLDVAERVLELVWGEVTKHVPEDVIEEVVLDEVANEPDPTWVTPEEHDRIAQYLSSSGSMVCSNTRHVRDQDQRYASWPYRNGLVRWLHLEPASNPPNNRIPSSKIAEAYLEAGAPACAERMQGRAKKWGAPVGFSTDGVRLLDERTYPLRDIAAAISLSGPAPISVEVMANYPMKPWAPDEEIPLGFDIGGQWHPVTWRGRSKATTRWVFEQVYAAMGVGG